MVAPIDPFESWKESCRQFQPPTDFSAHVMDRIRHSEILRPLDLTGSLFFGLSAVEKALRLLLALGARLDPVDAFDVDKDRARRFANRQTL